MEDTSAMAHDSFHLFNCLPFELRRMIYLFASPPRFVHIKEKHEDPEDFEERFRTTLVQIKLHPSIAYFARNWRGRIPFPRPMWTWHDGRHQTTLERYGLRGPPPKHLPWKPTREVPNIPHGFLAENPDVAWEFLRTGSFYSSAPIPAMLHVSRESRQFLVECGYELAFRTRTCGPRTWFNFKTDILYVGEWEPAGVEDRALHSLLSGNKSWDIGQFDPQDLHRVRRLALEASSRTVTVTPDFHFPNGPREISSILELFTGVEELFLHEYNLHWVNHRFPAYFKPDKSQLLWSSMPILEVDALFTMFEDCDILCSITGYGSEDLRAFKKDNMGDGSNFFLHTARKFEEKLASRRDELVNGGTVASWKIPHVSRVHILPQWICKGLQRWRWDIWNHHLALKEEDARVRAIEEARLSIDVPKRPIYERNPEEDAPRSPFSEQFRYDLEALEEAIAYDNPPYYNYYEERRLRNWLRTATISAPEQPAVQKL
ncbi:hypothetical protein F5Y01DRAFT_266250 [Xylaria sp. FL0043]|nr:hypothetical protein F5Y01DRAFT_266250 [Xylaria sp. FL0043]